TTPDPFLSSPLPIHTRQATTPQPSAGTTGQPGALEAEVLASYKAKAAYLEEEGKALAYFSQKVGQMAQPLAEYTGVSSLYKAICHIIQQHCQPGNGQPEGLGPRPAGNTSSTVIPN